MAECKFNKVLVANRGEIAIRVFRACYDLGLHTVAMYSNEDTFSLFRTKADEAYLIGENKSPLGAYLDIPSIIDLARRRNVDAIHPGYGFLSENADFARACEEAGITFIGPSSTSLAQMGDKLTAKAIAHACGVPTIPGSDRPLKDGEEALAKAVEYGFPIILKAAGGGGGRGMRRCDKPEEVIPAFDLVKSEAKKAFGNEDIFIEKYLVEPKHIEVQILGDKHGNVVHLFERDCSLQRRYQKVVEFAPAFSVPEATRQKLYEDAVKVALAEAERRVQAIATVHAALSQNVDESVDFDEVARTIVRMAGAIASTDHGVEVITTGNFGTISADQAQALATVLNELVANSVEHGLADRDGRIEVCAQREGLSMKVTVADDGVGFVPGTPMSGLGTQIVHQMVRGELRGSIEWAPREGGGTLVTLWVNLDPA